MASSRCRHCLLCWSPMSMPSNLVVENDVDGYSEMAGAEGNVQLKRQLLHWFILRKLMDIPLDWCKAKLASVGDGPESWFWACDECLNSLVLQAWSVHQRVLKLEEKITRIKIGMRMRINESWRKSGWEGRLTRWEESDGVALEIRKMAVSDSYDTTIQVSKSEDKHFDKTQETLDDHLSSETDCSPGDNENDYSDSIEDDHDVKPKIKNENIGNHFDSANSTRKSYRKAKRRPTGACRKKTIQNPVDRTNVQRNYFPPKNSCHLCSCLPFSTSSELQNHLQLHQERSVQDNNLSCPQCTFPAQDPHELKLHIFIRHTKDIWIQRSRQYPCPLCPLKIRIWSRILHHIRVRHETANQQEITAFKDRYLKCNQCEFHGNHPRELIVHNRHHHNPAIASLPPVREEDCRRCEDCGMLFASDKEFQVHVSNTHNRASAFVCDICGKGFPLKVRLDDHKVSHARNTQRDWICDVCGVDFPRPRQLKVHCKKYHSRDDTSSKGIDQEKVYKCRYCDLTSPYNAVIRKHLQIHKQEGDHKCPKCDKCYVNARGLKRHLKINHDENGEEVVQCPHCLKSFPSKEYMMIHVRKVCKLAALSTQKA